MSWLISFIVSGAVLVSGNNLYELQGQFQTVQSSSVNSPVVLDESEKFEKTYSFDANGKIEISNINGSITIDSWDRNEIKFAYEKTADTKERLSQLDVDIDAGASSFKVEAKYQKDKEKGKVKWEKGARLSVDFRLTVPKTARLEQVESVNGSVTVSNMTNSSEISAVNGTVKATNLRGNASLSTVNGKVFADFDQLDSSTVISLETVNGSVDLVIPSDSSATVKAGTVHGGIKNDFNLPVRKGKYVGHDLYGKIGNGDVQIKLNSVNGGLSIIRKNDGKSLSPVTNLLNLKTSDDDDDELDFEIGVSRSTGERAKAIARAGEARIISEGILKSGELTEIEVEKLTRESLKVVKEAMKNIDIDKIRIDKEKLKEKIKQIELEQAERLENISEAMFLNRAPYLEEKTESFAVSGIPTVDIDAKTCAVFVRGWDKDEVKYSVTRVQRGPLKSPVFISAKQGEKIEIAVSESVQDERGFGKPGEIRIEVFVPKKSNLEIRTQRELRVERVSGNIKLKSENGAVNLRDLGGKLDLSVANKYRNQVRIVGFEGELLASLVNSDTYLEGDFEDIRASGKSSCVYLTLDDSAGAMIETESFGLNGNFKTGSAISIGGINVVKTDSSTWRVGEGGAKYRFNLSDGEMFIRSRHSISGS